MQSDDGFQTITNIWAGGRERVSIRVGPLIPISPRLVAPDGWERKQIEVDGGGIASIVSEWSPSAFDYEIRELRITKEPGSVKATDLRAIALQTVVNSTRLLVAKQFALGAAQDGTTWVDVQRELIDRAENLRGNGPTAAVLEVVAGLYEIAAFVGDPPVRDISDVFEIPERTATNWVKLARERGHLEERMLRRGS